MPRNLGYPDFCIEFVHRDICSKGVMLSEEQSHSKGVYSRSKAGVTYSLASMQIHSITSQVTHSQADP